MKTPLTITRADAKRNVLTGDDDRFTVMINPEQLKHDQRIHYNETRKLAQNHQKHRFSAIGSDTVSFELTLDGTGVVRQDVEAPEVSAQLRKLRSIVYTVDAKRSEPSHVRLLWGSFLFFGRLTTFNTAYTLFKPSGEPLRAKLTLAFVGSVQQGVDEPRATASDNSSVKSVQVREGDTLPNLCKEHYGNAACFPEVASHNGLSQVTPLQAGDWLELPFFSDED